MAVAAAVGLAAFGVLIFWGCQRLKKRAPVLQRLTSDGTVGTMSRVFDRRGGGGGVSEMGELRAAGTAVPNRQELMARSRGQSSWRPILRDEDSEYNLYPDNNDIDVADAGGSSGHNHSNGGGGYLSVTSPTPGAEDSNSSSGHTSSGNMHSMAMALMQQQQQQQREEWARIAAATPPSLLNPPLSKNKHSQSGSSSLDPPSFASGSMSPPPLPPGNGNGLLMPPRLGDLGRSTSEESTPGPNEMLPKGLIAGPAAGDGGDAGSMVDYMDYTRPMKPVSSFTLSSPRCFFLLKLMGSSRSLYLTA